MCESGAVPQSRRLSEPRELPSRAGRGHRFQADIAHFGHAVAGDDFYASPEVLLLAPRLLLHAEELRLRDPGTGRPIALRANSGW